jgi:hypothetical protein
MTDKELLEAAANAAGLIDRKYCADRRSMSFYNSEEGCHFGAHWRPLDDDGDALRLAVAVWIDVTEAQNLLHDEIGNAAYHANTLASTRRAIVRAAALGSRHSAV